MPLPPVITDVDNMRRCVREWQQGGMQVGVVPTMGALHEGHLSLVRAATHECDKVVATIFVNPTQFGPSEDFARYPRELSRDSELLATVGCDVVFSPTTDGMYPDKFSTSIDVGSVAEPWEGASRPTHFAGVATVVCKLLNIVPADFAYFGQKDYQQTVVVRQMVRDLNVATTIRVCPTIREDDGLAMSSRNAYLSPDERQAALVLSQSLFAARQQIEQGEASADVIRTTIQQRFAAEPLAQLDYVAILRDGTVESIENIDGPAVIALAARVGKTRLIDNMRIDDVGIAR